MTYFHQRCDCYGHGNSCAMHAANGTHNASYSCVCDPGTFTEGSQVTNISVFFVTISFLIVYSNIDDINTTKELQCVELFIL